MQPLYFGMFTLIGAWPLLLQPVVLTRLRRSISSAPALSLAVIAAAAAVAVGLVAKFTLVRPIPAGRQPALHLSHLEEAFCQALAATGLPGARVCGGVAAAAGSSECNRALAVGSRLCSQLLGDSGTGLAYGVQVSFPGQPEDSGMHQACFVDSL